MFVIDAALDYVLQKDLPIVIEATCNQINQFGGYTGLLPKDFSKKIRSLATVKGIENCMNNLFGLLIRFKKSVQ